VVRSCYRPVPRLFSRNGCRASQFNSSAAQAITIVLPSKAIVRTVRRYRRLFDLSYQTLFTVYVESKQLWKRVRRLASEGVALRGGRKIRTGISYSLPAIKLAFSRGGGRIQISALDFAIASAFLWIETAKRTEANWIYLRKQIQYIYLSFDGGLSRIIQIPSNARLES